MPAAPLPSPGATGDARHALGLLGERVAARWLTRRGWTVVAHRFRSGHRDLDLVVRQGSLVAFVEVKARRGDGFGGPLAALHGRKRRELVRCARAWVATHGAAGLGYRFDVIGVLVGAAGVRVRHVADAFQVTAER